MHEGNFAHSCRGKSGSFCVFADGVALGSRLENEEKTRRIERQKDDATHKGAQRTLESV